jgi:hypothetical protein
MFGRGIREKYLSRDNKISGANNQGIFFAKNLFKHDVSD